MSAGGLQRILPATEIASTFRQAEGYQDRWDQLIEPQGLAIYLTRRYYQPAFDGRDAATGRDPKIAMAFANLVQEHELPLQYSQAMNLLNFSDSITSKFGDVQPVRRFVAHVSFRFAVGLQAYKSTYVKFAKWTFSLWAKGVTYSNQIFHNMDDVFVSQLQKLSSELFDRWASVELHIEDSTGNSMKSSNIIRIDHQLATASAWNWAKVISPSQTEIRQRTDKHVIKRVDIPDMTQLGEFSSSSYIVGPERTIQRLNGVMQGLRELEVFLQIHRTIAEGGDADELRSIYPYSECYIHPTQNYAYLVSRDAIHVAGMTEEILKSFDAVFHLTGGQRNHEMYSIALIHAAGIETNRVSNVCDMALRQSFRRVWWKFSGQTLEPVFLNFGESKQIEDVDTTDTLVATKTSAADVYLMLSAVEFNEYIDRQIRANVGEVREGLESLPQGASYNLEALLQNEFWEMITGNELPSLVSTLHQARPYLDILDKLFEMLSLPSEPNEGSSSVLMCLNRFCDAAISPPSPAASTTSSSSVTNAPAVDNDAQVGSIEGSNFSDTADEDAIVGPQKGGAKPAVFPRRTVAQAKRAKNRDQDGEVNHVRTSKGSVVPTSPEPRKSYADAAASPPSKPAPAETSRKAKTSEPNSKASKNSHAPHGSSKAAASERRNQTAAPSGAAKTNAARNTKKG